MGLAITTDHLERPRGVHVLINVQNSRGYKRETVNMGRQDSLFGINTNAIQRHFY
jgi:hypothetical protein